MLRILLICIISLSFISNTFAMDKSESSFNVGIKLFKQKNYPLALSYFIKAQSQGMETNALYFNIGVTYYKLGNYPKSEDNFKKLLRDKNLRQIASYNIGLIAEKRQQNKIAVSWYTKAANDNQNEKITYLANNQIDKLLNKKQTLKNKIKANVRLAFGNDNNITTTTSNSPSNKSDNYLELFAYIKAPISQNINFNGNIYSINYSNFSTENFMFYEAGIDYSSKIKSWNIIPAISLIQSTYNNTSYQSILDLNITGKHKFKNKSHMAIRYRYNDIKSENTLYNYLQGTRHQFRVDYNNSYDLGELRLRYQLELNDRQNTLTANYSPIRHEFRARLRHKLKNNWDISEEIGLRISNYGTALGITRNDSRLRLNVTGSKYIKKNLQAGINYNYTSNQSNIVNETYTKNKIQIFANWGF